MACLCGHTHILRLTTDRQQQPSDLSGYEIPDRKARKKATAVWVFVKKGVIQVVYVYQDAP